MLDEVREMDWLVGTGLDREKPAEPCRRANQSGNFIPTHEVA